MQLQGRVALHVQGQVVRARESSIAEFTVEGLVPGVLALVARQLVGARKPPAAVLPLADVGLLAGVGAEVRLQVGGLGVGLAAACLVTNVHWRGLTLQHNHHLLLLLLLTGWGGGQHGQAG